MAQFSVNPQRFDPYKNFKFRVKWDGKYVAGISKVGGLKRSTEVVKHREGGDPSSSRKSPGRTEYDPITLERGVTHDADFGTLAIHQQGPLVGIVYLRPGHIDPQFTVATIQAILGVDPDLDPPFVLVAKRSGRRVTIRVRGLAP